MQSGKLEDKDKYDLAGGKFRTAFQFLQRPDLAQLSEGWMELADGVRASVQRYVTSPAEHLDFETHRRYFDVHYIVDGAEMVGVVSAEGLTEKIPYDPENDIAFYREPQQAGTLLLNTGDYVVLAPEDAHKPRCTVGTPREVKKIVVKVPV